MNLQLFTYHNIYLFLNFIVMLKFQYLIVAVAAKTLSLKLMFSCVFRILIKDPLP